MNSKQKTRHPWKSLAITAFLAAGGLFSAAIAQQFNEATVRNLYAAKDLNGMQQYCGQWLRQDPNDWNANDYMGCALYEGKQFDKSIPYFEKAMEVKPGIAFTYKQLALAWGYNDRFDKMLAAMNLGRERASGSFDYQMWRWYGAWYGKWGAWSDSVSAWQRAYDMQPSPASKMELANAYYGKGHAEAFAQKLDESEADLKKAITLGDPNAKSYLEVVTKYHYTDKPKWTAEAQASARAYAEELRRHPPPTTGHFADLNQLEYRTRVYQAGHPDSLDTHAHY